jgi:hypothetical protein
MRTTADPVPTGTQTLPNPKATEGTLLGYSDLRQQSPELALLLIAFDLRCRWRCGCGCGDDVASHLGDVGAAIGLAIELDWLDVVRTSTLRGLVFGFCGPACVVLLVVVLFRLELYTERIGHQMGHVRSPTPGYLVLHKADCWTIGIRAPATTGHGSTSRLAPCTARRWSPGQ